MIFDNIWIKFKDFFALNDVHKCAYCERTLNGECVDIDHYAPKGQVSILQNPGTENPSGTAANNRIVTKISLHPGYWWLAYSWKNYIPSCHYCNGVWKKTIFPVEKNYKMDPNSQVQEIPMLINPFDENPEIHMEFDSMGAVIPKTPKGNKTVETLGLDRPSLIISRMEIADKFENLYKIYLMEQDDDKLQLDIWEIGRDNQPHAAVVRSLLYKMLEIRWEDISND